MKMITDAVLERSTDAECSRVLAGVFIILVVTEQCQMNTFWLYPKMISAPLLVVLHLSVLIHNQVQGLSCRYH